MQHQRPDIVVHRDVIATAGLGQAAGQLDRVGDGPEVTQAPRER